MTVSYEREVFVPGKETAIYNEWVRCSGSLARKIKLPVSIVRAHIISDTQQTPHKNAHRTLLEECRLASITSPAKTRAHILGNSKAA